MDLEFVREKVKTLWDQQELFRYTNKAVTDGIENLDKPVIAAIVNATSENYEEGMRAFNEKRKPVFKGR